MKKYIVLSLFSIVFLVVGFLLSAYIIGKHSERQLKESVINEKLVLMNLIATEISNLTTVSSSQSIIKILCNQVSPLKNEAISIGRSDSKGNVPDHIEYTDFVVDQYSKIASKYEVAECEI